MPVVSADAPPDSPIPPPPGKDGGRNVPPVSQPTAAEGPTGWRERVSERLGDRPVLRFIALNPVSAGIVIVMLLAVLSFGVSVLKVWRTTPKGFRPVVRISLLDHLQAWSLQRSAEESLAAGDERAAAQAYLSAAQNNLGDVELVRRAIETMVKAVEPGDRKQTGRAIDTATWLLLLSRTNENDVFLAARLYDVLGDSYTVLRLLEPSSEEIPEGLYGVMAKARFDSGDAGAFGDWWARTGEEQRQDPVLALYHAAWKAGWGTPEEAAEFQHWLEDAADALDQRLLVNRLLLRVTRQRGDVAGYGRTLDRLEGFQGDRMADHVDYWRMLRTAGNRDEALRLARNHPYPPRHALEAVQFGLALSELGDSSTAREMLERYGPRLGDGPATFCLPLWALLGDLYIKEKAWPRLAAMGADIRSLPYGNITMSGFGWFVEGRALVELGDRPGAGEMFDAAIREGLPRPELGLEVGTILLEVGFPERAQRLLRPLEGPLAARVDYWQALFEAAYALRQDEALLLKAARNALDLDPGNVIWRLNYAVALMTNRQRPEEAVRLTLDFAAGNRLFTPALLNHAHALAMVGRGAEATRVMSRLPPPTDPDLVASYALVELEISLARRDDEAAREALQRVDESLLFPSQVQWLNGVRARLNAGTGL